MKAAIVWLQGPTSGYYDDHIYCRYFDGEKWELPKDASDSLSIQPAPNYHYGAEDISLDINQRGDLILAWSQVINYQKRIFVATRFNNVWKKPGTIDETISEAGKSYSYPTVAIDNYRNRILTYFEDEFFVRKSFK